MSFKLAIDAGHGLCTAGKRCLASIDPNETREWTLNSRIADKLIAMLVNYDVEIIRIDDATGQTDVSLDDRTNKANAANVDFYLSIHHNSGINGGDGGGLQVYRYLNTTDAATIAWQDCIYDALITAGISAGNRSNGKPLADFAVLRQTHMPAVLCEMSFMDSTVDTPIILTDDFANKAAQGLLNAIVSHANLNGKSNQVNIETAVQAQPVEQTSAPVVNTLPCSVYQVYVNGRWLPNVIDDSDFAGIKSRAIQALYVNLSDGSVQYQVHTVGGNWLPWVTDRQDYAGLFSKNIDAVRVKLSDDRPYSIQCRVAPIGHDYYPWVTDNNDYAGVFGKAIDRIQIRTINK